MNLKDHSTGRKVPESEVLPTQEWYWEVVHTLALTSLTP